MNFQVLSSEIMKVAEDTRYEKISYLRKIDVSHIPAFHVIEQALEDGAFPGAALIVLYRGQIFYSKAFGTLDYQGSCKVTLDTLFDLASLTKVLATTTCLMKLYEEGKIKIDDPLTKYFPYSHSELTLRQLLVHQSGLKADVPKEIWEKNDEEKIWEYIFADVENAKPNGETLYSDINFILLGKVVEIASGETLEQHVKRHFFEPLNLQRTVFCPLQKGFSLNEIAPTEGIVHGTVHDEKARVLGGITGHAGLFSSASDICRFMQMLLNGGEGLLKPETIELFISPQPESDSYCLGWERRLPFGYYSKTAFGHLGFTGTSVWADREKELCILFFSNRVHPSRENIKIREVRRTLVNAIFQSTIGVPK